MVNRNERTDEYLSEHHTKYRVFHIKLDEKTKDPSVASLCIQDFFVKFWNQRQVSSKPITLSNSTKNAFYWKTNRENNFYCLRIPAAFLP